MIPCQKSPIIRTAKLIESNGECGELNNNTNYKKFLRTNSVEITFKSIRRRGNNGNINFNVISPGKFAIIHTQLN